MQADDDLEEIKVVQFHKKPFQTEQEQAGGNGKGVLDGRTRTGQQVGEAYDIEIELLADI